MAGLLVYIYIMIVVCRAEDSAEAEFQIDDDLSEVTKDCCQSHYLDDLDPSLGLLAVPRVEVAFRRLSSSLTCPIAAGPQFDKLTFKWRKEGKEIKSSSSGKFYIYPNGTLFIRKILHRVRHGVEASDEGLYECFVSSSVGTALAQRIQLVVASVQKNFTLEPKEGTIAVGENFFLPCQILGNPMDLMTIWQKDDAELKVDQNARYISTKNGLLVLDAHVEDSGMYQCQVTNKNYFAHVPYQLQWRNSYSALLTVTDKAPVQSVYFLLTPQNVTEVLMGDSIDLNCVPSTFHHGIVVWTHAMELDANIISVLETSDDFTVLPNGSLRLHRAGRQHAGTYTCSLTNTDLSASGTLHVLEEPVIQDSPPSCVYPLSSSIHLKCVVAGHPAPHVRWLKNGKEITSEHNKQISKGYLTIYQSNLEDSGYYQCLAENKVGWALSLMQLDIQLQKDAPSAPYNLTGKAISSSTILVRWEFKEHSTDLITFTVHKRLVQGRGREEEVIVERQYREVMLRDLLPDTIYAITVRAYKKQGASPSSEPVFIRTDISDYPSPVVTYMSNSSIYLNWSNFHLRHRRHDDIVAYQVYYGLRASQDVEQITLNSTENSLLLTGLKENREYRVRMSADFNGGSPQLEDENWLWSYFRTDNVSVPDIDSCLAAPFNLHAFPLKPDAISLTWTYSKVGLSSALPVTHYTVRCEMLESVVIDNQCHDVSAKSVLLKTSHSNMVTLENLQAFTTYNISVSANSDNLEGPSSQPILVKTKEDVPSPPENLMAEVVAAGQVHLHWQPPTWPNGLIQGHYIHYISQHLFASDKLQVNDSYTSSWVQLYQKGNKTKAMVGDLKNRVYLFQVIACTNAGVGEPSNLIFVHMKEVNKNALTDQHLGILGGSVIGLTSIIITVVVIVCKQREYQKRLNSQISLEQERRLLPPECRNLWSPAPFTAPVSLALRQKEELEELLAPPPLAHLPLPALDLPVTQQPCDLITENDSGCSSILQAKADTLDSLSDDCSSTSLMEMENESAAAEEVIVWDADVKASVKNDVRDGTDDKETTC